MMQNKTTNSNDATIAGTDSEGFVCDPRHWN
jgi:hypothetical protein